MSDRFTYIGSSYLFLIREEKILLLRRANTGFMDGFYGVPAGHLDGNESARAGGAREFNEEIGITVRPEDLQVVHVMHRKAAKDERFDFFMTADTYEGEIQNCEPNKCDGLNWFPLNRLPENMVDYVKVAIKKYQEGELYSEFGY
jgi:8-oxo-dGTP pyrophosphatase MutT (NUDIX family)